MEIESALAVALPGYEIGAELGRGAFGVVLAGRHRQLGREVAIKQLVPALVSDASVRLRFLAEAQVLASINSPYIVPVYDYVEHDDACILVMERLGGGTVWSRFVDRGFDQRTACVISLVACSGLSAAHHHGVLHRDMKPENVLFGDDNVLKVTDFGIARVLGEDDTLATREGEILGTPAYMAPEQASGADLGPTTDVYAAGVMLYELLSGRLPYPEEGGSLATVLRHINEDATPLADVAPAVPAPLSEAVMRALARDPADRFESAEEFGVAIGEAASSSWGGGWLDRTGIPLREPGPILASTQRGPAGVGAGGGRGGGVTRPAVELHAGGAAGPGLELDDLMPLRQSPVTIPEFPTRLAWAAVLVGLLAVILGLLGVGSSSPAPSLAPGSVTVAGHDPAAGGRVPLNLERLIPIRVLRLPASAGVPTTAQLVLSLGGLAVIHSTSAPFVHGPGGLVTTVDASAGRYIVGGKLAGSLKLSGPQGTLTDDFGVQATNSPFSTFGGVVGIVLLLIVAAYTESLLRSLRRGRRRDNRTAAVVGLAVVGAFGGVTATLWGWMLGITGPTLVPFVVAAAVGAVAGLLAGLAGRRVGERTRARRQSNRLVLVAKRRAAPPAEPAAVGVGS
ncbi:MAG: protein kinase domain-containing protein [Acidimicrobiales bacterium]